MLERSRIITICINTLQNSTHSNAKKSLM